MIIVFLMQDIGAVYGAEKATLDLAEGLRDQGVDIRIWLIEEVRIYKRASRQRNVQVLPDDFISTSKTPAGRVRVPADRTNHRPGMDDRPSNPLREALDSARIPWEAYPVKHAFSPSLIRTLRKRLIRDDITILHCVGYKADVHGGLAARFGRIVPCVSTVHGWLHRTNAKERLYGWLNKQVLKRFQRVHALSRYYEQLLTELGIETVVRIPTGFPVRELAHAALAGHRTDAPQRFRAGMLGRLSEEKNHEMLLKSARKLIDRGFDGEFLIAGTGTERDRIEKRIGQWGLADRVTLMGHVDSDSFMRDIDLFIVCSRMENLPYVILEAMNGSVPVVATRVGGIPDLVEDGVTGYLIAPNHVEELADRIEAFSNDPDMAYSMGLAGRTKLEREFSRECAIKAHLELYKELCDEYVSLS